jgi:hypothetical protein
LHLRHVLENEPEGVNAWSSDASSYRISQGYKKRLVHQACEGTMKEMMMGHIADVFASNNPRMVEMRS